MNMFLDRKDAGQKLALALSKYKNKGVLVLGIPRGGAEIAYEIADYLDADMSLLVTRKLPLPFNPEAGFGAIAEDGSLFIKRDAGNWLSRDEMKRIIEKQKAEIFRRITVLRKGEALPIIKNRTVILADDGLAMGSTMRASVTMCKNMAARIIIVAVPVSSKETAGEMESLVDELVVLETPPFFQAVAQVYLNWHDVSDNEVQAIMERWKMKHEGKGYMEDQKIDKVKDFKKKLGSVEKEERLEQKIEQLKQFSQSLRNFLIDNGLVNSEYAREFIDLYDSGRYAYEEEKVIVDARSVLDDLEKLFSG